jgi:hypothetical protein
MFILFFQRLTKGPSGAQDRIGITIQSTGSIAFVGLLNAMAIFPADRNLYFHESKSSARYSPATFVITYTVVELGFEILGAMGYAAIVSDQIIPRKPQWVPSGPSGLLGLAFAEPSIVLIMSMTPTTDLHRDGVNQGRSRAEPSLNRTDERRCRDADFRADLLRVWLLHLGTRQHGREHGHDLRLVDLDRGSDGDVSGYRAHRPWTLPPVMIMSPSCC